MRCQKMPRSQVWRVWLMGEGPLRADSPIDEAERRGNPGKEIQWHIHEAIRLTRETWVQDKMGHIPSWNADYVQLLKHLVKAQSWAYKQDPEEMRGSHMVLTRPLDKIARTLVEISRDLKELKHRK